MLTYDNNAGFSGQGHWKWTLLDLMFILFSHWVLVLQIWSSNLVLIPMSHNLVPDKPVYLNLNKQPMVKSLLCCEHWFPSANIDRFQRGTFNHSPENVGRLFETIFYETFELDQGASHYMLFLLAFHRNRGNWNKRKRI